MPEASLDREQFLRSPQRTVSATNPAVQARWGAAAGDTAAATPLISESAAAAAAALQVEILGSVMVEDQLLIEGIWRDVEGRVVEIDYSHPAGGTWFGGAATVAMLVTRARVDLNAGTTLFQGLIRL
ncbi:MAG: hypothetical protein KGQ52_13800 [Alphaproteobacteria bacterium]|nr:hypothetical protein [Alphaproteobacteria bacterium]